MRNLNVLTWRNISLTVSLGLGTIGLQNCSHHKIDAADKALKTIHHDVGVVPGIVAFNNGDVAVRPMGEANGSVDCSDGDMALHDDASSFVYRKHGKLLRATKTQVEKVEIADPAYAQADQASADFVLRQCISTEGPVKLEDNGYCVPIGLPNPESEYLAVGVSTNSIAVAEHIRKTNDCK